MCGAALVIVSSLTFLGIGVVPPTPTWGGLLATDLQYLYQRPWGPVAPAALIVATVWALNALADALRDAQTAKARRGEADAAPSEPCADRTPDRSPLPSRRSSDDRIHCPLLEIAGPAHRRLRTPRTASSTASASPCTAARASASWASRGAASR